MEHPSNHEGISGINCPHCLDTHELEDIQPLVVKYEDEPHFNHFEFSCGENRATMFLVPDDKLAELEEAGVPVASLEFVPQHVIDRCTQTTGVPYVPADKLDMLDVAEFHERLDAVDNPSDIRW